MAAGATAALAAVSPGGGTGCIRTALAGCGIVPATTGTPMSIDGKRMILAASFGDRAGGACGMKPRDTPRPG